MCVKNRKDVEEVPANYIKDLTFHYVDQVDEVLGIALLPEKVNNPMNFVFPDEKKEKEESGFVTMTV